MSRFVAWAAFDGAALPVMSLTLLRQAYRLLGRADKLAALDACT